jgi:hypothetical protein
LQKKIKYLCLTNEQTEAKVKRFGLKRQAPQEENETGKILISEKNKVVKICIIKCASFLEVNWTLSMG